MHRATALALIAVVQPGADALRRRRRRGRRRCIGHPKREKMRVEKRSGGEKRKEQKTL